MWKLSATRKAAIIMCRRIISFCLTLYLGSLQIGPTLYLLILKHALVVLLILLSINLYLPYFVSCIKSVRRNSALRFATMVLKASVYMNMWFVTHKKIRRLFYFYRLFSPIKFCSDLVLFRQFLPQQPHVEKCINKYIRLVKDYFPSRSQDPNNW